MSTPNIDRLAETFDIGRDTGTQVSKLYTGPFPFNGELDRADPQRLKGGALSLPIPEVTPYSA